MEILAFCLVALFPILAIAAPYPAYNAGPAPLPGLAPPVKAPTAGDLYSDVLGTAGRAASIAAHVKDVEEAQYESAVRHMPLADDAVVVGGLERRKVPKGRGRKHEGWQEILSVPHANFGNAVNLPEADYRQQQLDSAPDRDVDWSGSLLDALQDELIGRYPHIAIWKQSRSPERFYKVANV